MRHPIKHPHKGIPSRDFKMSTRNVAPDGRPISRVDRCRLNRQAARCGMSSAPCTNSPNPHEGVRIPLSTFLSASLQKLLQEASARTEGSKHPSRKHNFAT